MYVRTYFSFKRNWQRNRIFYRLHGTKMEKVSRLAYSSAPVSKYLFSKMLHFIRDATFHLHWRSFREKVSLTDSRDHHTHTHTHPLVRLNLNLISWHSLVKLIDIRPVFPLKTIVVYRSNDVFHGRKIESVSNDFTPRCHDEYE